MQKYTVKVDLSLFYNDARKHVLILVDSEWANVKKLQEHVEDLFGLKKIRFQTPEGLLLPSRESVEIVKYVHEIKAFAGRFKKKKQDSGLSASRSEECIAMESQQCKRKLDSLSLQNSPPSSTNTAKRLKNTSTTLEATSKNKSDVISSTRNDSRADIQNVTNEVRAVAQEVDIAEQSFCEQLPVDASVAKKRKSSSFTNNKKHRNSSFASSTFIERRSADNEGKQQQTKNSHIYFEKPTNLSCAAQETASEYSQASQDTLTNSKSSVKAPTENVVFRCFLNEQPKDMPRIFKTNEKRQKSTPIEIQEQIIISDPLISSMNGMQTDDKGKPIEEHNEGNHVADLSKESFDNSTSGISKESFDKSASEVTRKSFDKTATELTKESLGDSAKELSKESLVKASNCTAPAEQKLNESSILAAYENDHAQDGESSVLSSCESVIELNETEDASSSKLNTTNDDVINIQKILPFATDLNDQLPDVGDILIFKLHYEKKKNILLSNFIAGPCQYFNKRTKTVKLAVHDGKDEISKLPAHVQCNLDVSDNENICVSVKILEMIEPKIFKIA